MQPQELGAFFRFSPTCSNTWSSITFVEADLDEGDGTKFMAFLRSSLSMHITGTLGTEGGLCLTVGQQWVI